MSNLDKTPSLRRRALVDKADCPMAQAAEILGDRWTLLILREAFYGVQRYDDMRQDLQAPRSMLTDRLSKLVSTGLMKRKAYQEPGDRVRYAYVLTHKGRDLALTFMAMTQWGERHVLQGETPVIVADLTRGGRLNVALVDDAGRPVEGKKAALVKKPKTNPGETK